MAALDRTRAAGPLVSRWSAFLADRQIVYVDTTGTLYVATADGAEPSAIADSVCGGTGSGKLPITWSRNAARITILCGVGSGHGDQPSLEIYDLDAQDPPVVVDNVSTYVWSPAGHSIVYQVAIALAQPRWPSFACMTRTRTRTRL